MGLSNYNRYQITEHAKVRYFERINNNATEEKMMKDFLTFLQNATFLSKENYGKESWFYPKGKYVLITDPVNLKVITIYSTLSQKESLKEKDIDILEVKNLHEAEDIPQPVGANEVKKAMSEFAKESIVKATRKHYEHISGMYAEYADRMEKLAKTTKPDMFRKKQDELVDLNENIKRTENDFLNIVKEFNTYVVN